MRELTAPFNTDAIQKNFGLPGVFAEYEQIHDGHINYTYKIVFEADGVRTPYLLQKINTDTFKDPDALMENILGVTEHIRAYILKNGGDPDRETLNVIKTVDGKPYYRNEADTHVLVDLLAAGKLPLRVTHNDTKLNNVMFDNTTNQGICVIDLDTVMPGLSLYDFGDSIRFGANHAAEDEKDLSKVWLDLNLFENYVRGYLEATGGSLTETEIEYLPFSAKLLTFECGMRFLTDYLDGDTYFHVKYPEHNLDRCRTQFALVADMEKKMDEMKAIVAKYSK